MKNRYSEASFLLCSKIKPISGYTIQIKFYVIFSMNPRFNLPSSDNINAIPELYQTFAILYTLIIFHVLSAIVSIVSTTICSQIKKITYY